MTEAKLEAVIFDVDGTLAETERHGHRVAFNRAFEQLGLPDRWSDDMYRDLVKVTGGTRRLVHYFTTDVGMDPEEAAELGARLHKIKTAIFLDMIESGEVPPRQGVLRFMKDLQDSGLSVAVATTGTRSWVHPLVEQLRVLGGLEPYGAIVTGEQVAHLKPAPDAYNLALERLQLGPASVVAIEDSNNGVTSAIAAGCPCLAVQGEYARASDLEAAHLVVDGYGEPGSPLTVLYNPLGIEAGTMLTTEIVEQLHRRWQER